MRISSAIEVKSDISQYMSAAIIVIPCYNEEKRLEVLQFRKYAIRHPNHQFLFVNDGSSDRTALILDDLKTAVPDAFDVLHLPQNQGKAEAVRQGMLQAMHAGVDYAGFWDADLATPLEMIPEFAAQLDQTSQLSMVIGARVKLLGRQIERQQLRHYLGRTFATAASIVLKLPIYDSQCGAKLFRVTPECEALFATPFLTNWIFDVELLARARQLEKFYQCPALEETVYELPLTRWMDVAGSKVKPHDFLKAFFELCSIYWNYLRPSIKVPFANLAAQPVREETRKAA
ncbi:dolichyl-phosphate beta-glucosyltransferase [Gimesia fumaroli]|uniref:dolichyl-phosphate beta-glucosyltransferase n=1 Tax=Gimesia fumaroli TaxID=2527976 RepID=A0A518IHB8_9PLAN|nr:dolichyl-phosphate beta-glucosyltransferase [Gimesia fumaroli]QDV52440.1 Poly-beta-1,6-N-acetyl-D-glucosamine synthase [Gimesia fumaroli]